jgi:hypothetical protein
MLLKNLPCGVRFFISEDYDSVTFFKAVSSSRFLLDLLISLRVLFEGRVGCSAASLPV